MKKRHILLGLLLLLSVITYLDRICISVAGPRIQDALGLSPERWGWVLGIFVLSYGLGGVPLGALGERLGQRQVRSRIVVWWRVFPGLTAMAAKFAWLV